MAEVVEINVTTGEVVTRDLTPEERVDRETLRVQFEKEEARQATQSLLVSQASTALQSNRDYLTITAPTTTQMRNQIAALTRQNNKIIRLLVGALDGTD